MTKHLGTAKHKGNANDVVIQIPGNVLFLPGSSKSSTDNISQSVINAETWFQGFTIEHNLPLTINDHFTRLTRQRDRQKLFLRMNKLPMQSLQIYIFSWFYHTCTIFKVLTTQIVYPKCSRMHHCVSFWKKIPPPTAFSLSRVGMYMYVILLYQKYKKNIRENYDLNWYLQLNSSQRLF